MRVTAKVDYAVRAAMVLARVGLAEGGPVKGERIGQDQDIPVKYLENILSELRQAGLVRSQRGAEGGYWLARPPADIAIADLIRAVEGPLATVRESAPSSSTTTTTPRCCRTCGSRCGPASARCWST